MDVERNHGQVWLRFVCLVFPAAASLLCEPLAAREFVASIVKVRAVDEHGFDSVGSAVVIATGVLATACHVTRDAKSIEITQGNERWAGTIESGSPLHDLCIINVPQLKLPAVAIRNSGSLQLGERVFAAGFPNGGDLVIRTGLIEGLYPYDGGQVIRSSAAFDSGASGGGLFDEEGALVGVLAFKARTGAKLHFALPADWALPGTMVSSMLGTTAGSSRRRAFWEAPRDMQPSFLGHAILEAARQR